MIEFKEKFSIPHFLLVLSESNACDFRKEHLSDKLKVIQFNCQNKKLSLEFGDMIPPPFIVENDKKIIIIFGSPIYNDIIDKEKLGQFLLENFSTSSILNFIDGEFLFICFDKQYAHLEIVNDRWCSIPLFYSSYEKEKIFCASCYFLSMWQFLKDKNLLRLNYEAFFEFLWFQRLYGTKTLARDVSFLPDSHLLRLNNWDISLERYWQRNYTKNIDSFEKNAQKLAELVKTSIKLKTSDRKRYGHFLSGGMDSRSVLSAFRDNLPTCFTVGIAENREVTTAKKIAETKGAQHYFLKLDSDHYGKIRQAAVKICGGMYNYDHAIFLGYEDTVKTYADICFNGYGFDFMFQGMYIPGRNLRFLGRNLHYWVITELPDNLTDYFINNASYRIKGTDIFAYINESKRNNLREFLNNSISDILEQGKKLTDNKYDLWEYLTFHYLSRHYSYPNVLAIKTFAELRIISFTNEIFDFYLSLPIEYRFDGKIEKRLLEILDKQIAKIPSANTGMPITASRFERTFFQIFNAAKRRLIMKNDFESWTERTWPSREFALKNHSSLRTFAINLINSDALEELGFLDLKKIREDFKSWLKEEKSENLRISGDFFQTIVTIGSFLKDI